MSWSTMYKCRSAHQPHPFCIPTPRSDCLPATYIGIINLSEINTLDWIFLPLPCGSCGTHGLPVININNLETISFSLQSFLAAGTSADSSALSITLSVRAALLGNNDFPYK